MGYVQHRKSGVIVPTRTAMEIRSSAYDAAKTGGRRLGGWAPTSVGPNTVVSGTQNTLRARSRDAVRNNAWISNGVTNRVADEVGTGFTARAKSSDPAFNEACDRLWADWIGECDADGVLDFHGLVAQAGRARIEAGEAFLRSRPRRRSDGLTVPLQVQVLESELVPIERTEEWANVHSGIRFDAVGRRVAYRMYRAHPGEARGLRSSQIVEVPAYLVAHHYAPLRPGQIRGLPWTIQSLIKARDFDEYDDAELVRKKTRAPFTGFLKRPDLESEEDWQFDPITGNPIKVDGNGVPTMQTEPGTWLSGLPGEEPFLFDGDKTGEGYADYVRQQLLGVAAGLGVPHAVLTGDYKDVNDRVMRVILNQYRRIVEQSQWLLTIPQICAPIRTWFIDAAVLAGLLPATDYQRKRRDYLRTEWRADGWPYIHPEQDVNAKLTKIKAGLSSRELEVSQDGWDVHEIDRQNEADKSRASAAGLTYDAYPEPENSSAETEARVDNLRAERATHEARAAEFRARQELARAQAATETAQAEAATARARLDAATAERELADAAAARARAEADIRREDSAAERRAQIEREQADQALAEARAREEQARAEAHAADLRAQERGEVERQIEQEKLASARLERESLEAALAELRR